jgi:ESF2/ABP1 family protein
VCLHLFAHRRIISDVNLLLAHEAAIHRARLRVELSQSKTEQQQYLKNVELARVLDKRAAKKKEKGEEFELKLNPQPSKRTREGHDEDNHRKKPRIPVPDSVLQNIFT